MRLALYPGCVVATEQYAYHMSVREVLPRLGIEVIEMKGFSCCGAPVRSLSHKAWLYLSARNISIARSSSLDLLPLCNGCHLSLCEAMQIIERDGELRDDLNSLLAEEGLSYKGKVRVRHIVELLHDEVGLDTIRQSVEKPLDKLKFAAHSGCHALRPSELGRIDDPEDPKKLRGLIESLGAESPDYPERLDCCGVALLVFKPEAALTLCGLKLEAVQAKGFDGLITVCPLCQKMYDARQAAAGRILGESLFLPVLYYTQLLGMAMGIDGGLGLELNQVPLGKLIERIKKRS